MSSLIFDDRLSASPKSKITIERLHKVGNHIDTGNLPWYVYVAWTATGLTAINKKDLEDLEEDELMDCRPVAKRNTFKQTIIDITAPNQYGSGEKAGGS